MKPRHTAFVYVIAVALGLAAVPAQERSGDAQISGAVRRGVQFLKNQQRADGSWEYGGHEVGITALVGLALAENGVPATDSVLKRAVEYVRTHAPSNVQTYDISLAILFLSRAGESGDTPLIMDLGRRLVAGQLSSGGWGYVCPIIPPPSPASVTNNPNAKGATARRGGRIQGPGRVPQPGFGDNSNTQFGVLGVWAAGRAGLDVSATMQRVERRFRNSQSPRGGWGYGPGGDTDAMTCAGLMSLALAKGYRVVEAQMTNKPPAKDGEDAPGGKGSKMDSDPDLDQGIARVENYVSGIQAASSLYFLWSVERVGVALGLARIGRIDWYSRGAGVLVQTQRPDGSWQRDRGVLPDTSFALLFLRRSNLAEGMPQLVSSGRSGGTSDNRLRAGTLEELIQTVKPIRPPDEK
jgi:hypothetical protein